MMIRRLNVRNHKCKNEVKILTVVPEVLSFVNNPVFLVKSFSEFEWSKTIYFSIIDFLELKV